jgi:flagellar motor switch protein FliM
LSTKQSTTKKEIFFPSIIGDWTTYTSEQNKASISIKKAIGKSKKTISEETRNELLFFHQEFFETFLKQLISKINFHIDIESISIDTTTHEEFKKNLTEDLYQSKFNISELEQLDLILTKKTAKNICHRLCGGSTPANNNNDLTPLEVSIISIINNIFIAELSNSWSTIFPFIENSNTTHFGHYTITPQQSEQDTIIEINFNINLFNQSNLTIKLIYSLETIEKLLFFKEMLNSNINETIELKNSTLKKIAIPIKSIIGTTSLALNEIQNLTCGDVILLENHTINDPIKLIIDNQTQFNGHPILHQNKMATQILNHCTFKEHLENLNKPNTGPFITSTPPPVSNKLIPTKSKSNAEKETIDTNSIIEDDIIEDDIIETDDLDNDDLDNDTIETDDLDNDTDDDTIETDDLDDDTDDDTIETDDLDDDTDDDDTDNDDLDKKTTPDEDFSWDAL